MQSNQTRKLVLCFAENDSGRDVELMLPVRYFAETYLNCQFIHKTAYDVFAIYRYQPDIVFVPNTVGNHFYSEIAHYAHQQNIKVFALASEGNFFTDGSFNYWGVNKFKEFVQEYICMWNQPTTDFLKRELPEYNHKIVKTGGTGFDRYKIYEFLKKDAFLNKYNKGKFTKVIGYASWGVFGKLHHPEGLEFLNQLYSSDQEKLDWLERQRKYIESTLKQLIENNPDILFILKRHPTETHSHIQNREVLNDIINLQHYENVVYIRENENIHDLINVSDVWLGFESTTVLESWLLDKITIFINRDNFPLKRKQYHQGCLIAPDYLSVQQYLDEFYNNGTIEAFYAEPLVSKRKKIMADVFGFSDGLNHVRAGYYFQQTLEKAVGEQKLKKRRFSVKYFLMYIAMTFGRYFFYKPLFKKIKLLSKTIWVFETYHQHKVHQLYHEYQPFLRSFHQKKNIKERFDEGAIVDLL